MRNWDILRRHRVLSYIQSLLGLEMLIAPVMTIFYMRHVGLSFKDFAIYQSFIFLLGGFLQVPFGAIADSYGRKRCLVIADCLYLTAMLLLVIAPSKIIIYLSAFLFPLGTALGAGNQEAVIYEVFKKENALSELQHLLEKSSALRLFSGALASIVGAWVATYNLSLPMTVDSILLFISILFTVFFLVDDRKIQLFDSIESHGIKKGWATLIEGGKTLGKEPKIMLLFLTFACAIAIIRGTFVTYQPLLQDYKVSLQNFGIIFAVLGLISAFFSYLPSKLNARNKTFLRYGAVLTGVALLSAIVCQISTTSIGIFFALALHQVLRGLFGPFCGFQTNDHIRPAHPSRATLLSVSYLIGTVFCSMSILFIGHLTVHHSQKTAFVLNTVIFGVMMAIFLSGYYLAAYQGFVGRSAEGSCRSKQWAK